MSTSSQLNQQQQQFVVIGDLLLHSETQIKLIQIQIQSSIARPLENGPHSSTKPYVIPNQSIKKIYPKKVTVLDLVNSPSTKTTQSGSSMANSTKSTPEQVQKSTWKFMKEIKAKLIPVNSIDVNFDTSDVESSRF